MGLQPVENAKGWKHKTTRYAGAETVLIAQNHLSDKIELFKLVFKKKKGDFNGK